MCGVGGGWGVEAVWRCTVVLDDVCVWGVGVGGLEAVWRCTVVLDNVCVCGGEGVGGNMVVHSCT